MVLVYSQGRSLWVPGFKYLGEHTGSPLRWMTMNTAKDDVRLLLEQLPDECTLEDVQYHLYAAEKINRGITRANNGEVMQHEQVVEKFGRWLND